MKKTSQGFRPKTGKDIGWKMPTFKETTRSSGLGPTKPGDPDEESHPML